MYAVEALGRSGKPKLRVRSLAGQAVRSRQRSQNLKMEGRRCLRGWWDAGTTGRNPPAEAEEHCLDHTSDDDVFFPLSNEPNRGDRSFCKTGLSGLEHGFS